MSETLAHRLLLGCRTLFFTGNGGLLILLWILARATRPDQIPFTCRGGANFLLLMGGCIAVSLPVGLYLSSFLGLDVFGLNRLLGVPRGRPFRGLEPGEQARLALRTRGGLGFLGIFGFQLLLTDRRLLAGSSFTSWFLLEIALADIDRVEAPEGLLYRTALRIHPKAETGRRHWDVRLPRNCERARLARELEALGVGVTGAGPGDSAAAAG